MTILHRSILAGAAFVAAVHAQSIQFPGIPPFVGPGNQIPRTFSLPQHGSLSPREIVVGDVDGDFDTDVFLLGDHGLPLYINGVPDASAGNLVESIPSPAFGTFVNWTTGPSGERVDQISSNVSDGFLADMDNDGDLDLVIGTTPSGGGAVSMLVNTRMTLAGGMGLVGPLRFVDARKPSQGWTVPFPPAPVGVNQVVPLDIDLDGDTDVVAGTSAGLLLYTNNLATRTFTITVLAPTFTGDVRGLVAANLNGAGALDLAAAVLGGPDMVFLSPAFAPVALPTVAGNGAFGTSIAAGNIDGDGDTDLVAGHMPGFGTAGSDVVYVNNGAGAFAVGSLLTQLGGPGNTSGTGDIEMLDAEGDGDLDVVATSDGFSTVGRTRLLLNTGVGTYAPALGRIADDSSELSYALASADLDLDLDADILIGYWARPQMGLFPNHDWQHDADRTVPATGGQIQIQTFADAGYSAFGLAQTWLSVTPPNRPATPGPFGFSAIDSSWLALNVVAHTVPGGDATQVLPTAPLPLGLRIWMQSVLFDGVTVRASNITQTTAQ